jgi:hypothetical protein
MYSLENLEKHFFCQNFIICNIGLKKNDIFSMIVTWNPRWNTRGRFLTYLHCDCREVLTMTNKKCYPCMKYFVPGLKFDSWVGNFRPGHETHKLFT